ncbi:MAG: tol-pal system protein YbgF [Nitrospiraceae bacterium]|nr:MAG: tol-pal system protein YbgF [Nitrospiraceae bacterium]
MSIKNILFFIAVVLILASCASTEDVGRLQYDLINLHSEVRELKKSGGDGRQADKRLKELEGEQKATAKVVSDLYMKIQELTKEFQALTGHFEEARYASETGSREMAQQREAILSQLQELETTVAELEKKLASAAVMKAPLETKKTGTGEVPTVGQKPPGKQGVQKGSIGDIKNTYMDAYSTFKEGKFSDSREKFEALLKTYPENEYSDNARFWIGESYYREKNYEDAILAYEELIKTNPTSEKVPGAMMKQGLSFYELKDSETGEIILEKLIKDFPDSEQAKIAKKKLRQPTPLKKR